MLLDGFALVLEVLLVGFSAEEVGWGTGFRGGVVGGVGWWLRGLGLEGGSWEVVGGHC